MNFSERTNWPQEESAWAKNVAKPRPSGTIDLTESNPTHCRFRFTAGALKPFSDKANLQYDPDSCGSPAARRAVADYYQDRALSKPRIDQIVLTAGTSEAYSFLFKLLLNPGKAVLVPEPGYPLLDHLAQLSDAKIIRYPLFYDEGRGWGIDRPCLEKFFTSDVRAIVVVHPNNPTGHWTSDEDRSWLEDLAVHRGVALISDEVFLDFSFNPKQEPRSFAGNRKALTFTLSGISKILGLPQMKLSWIVASGPDKEVREALHRLAIIADAYLTVSSPSQNALPVWLSPQQLEIVHDEINQRIRDNRRTLEKALSVSQAKVLKADGGWNAIIRFSHEETDEELALELLKNGVLVQPGYLFDLPEHHLVVSLMPSPEIFNEGVRRLSNLV